MQDALREIIAGFAKKHAVKAMEDLRQYYSPTGRQIKLIQGASKSKGSFEDGWAHVFVSDKFGEATTHWRKLAERVHRGVGNPCPLLLIGIPREAVVL